MSANGNLGSGQLLVSDALITVLVANELRHRAIERVYGVSREQSNAVTAIAAASLVTGAQAGATKALAAVAVPSLAAALFGGAVLKEALHGVAGEASRNASGFSTLIAVAVIGASAVPMLRGARSALRGVGAMERQARTRVRTLLAPSE
jgi:hypothetical protein